jgi:hypothetical protein
MGNNSEIRNLWLKITVYGSIPWGGGGKEGLEENFQKCAECSKAIGKNMKKKWVKIFFPKPCLYYISTKCTQIIPKCFAMDFYGHLKH